MGCAGLREKMVPAPHAASTEGVRESTSREERCEDALSMDARLRVGLVGRSMEKPRGLPLTGIECASSPESAVGNAHVKPPHLGSMHNGSVAIAASMLHKHVRGNTRRTGEKRCAFGGKHARVTGSR